MIKPSPEGGYPQLGEAVKVRDFPDKLRLLLLVHHAVCTDPSSWGAGDELFSRTVLKTSLFKQLPTISDLLECWNGLEDHQFRISSELIDGHLAPSVLNRLIGWAVTPEGAIRENFNKATGRRLKDMRLVTLFKRSASPYTLVPTGILYRIVRGWRMIPEGVRANLEEGRTLSPRQMAERVRPEDFRLDAYKASNDDAALFTSFCGPMDALSGKPSSYGKDFDTFLRQCLNHYSDSDERSKDWPPPPAFRITLFPVHGHRVTKRGPAREEPLIKRRFPVRRSSIPDENTSPFDAGFEADLHEDGALWIKGTVADPAERIIFHAIRISAKLKDGPADGFRRPGGDVDPVNGVRFTHGTPVSARLEAGDDQTVGTILQDGFQLGRVVAPLNPFVVSFEVNAPLVQIKLADSGIGHNSNRTPADVVREHLSSVLARFAPGWERDDIVPLYRDGRFDFTDDKDE